ncbi:hypothetical protein OQA88_10778 [Cercophora sp. LCS_1]
MSNRLPEQKPPPEAHVEIIPEKAAPPPPPPPKKDDIPRLTWAAVIAHLALFVGYTIGAVGSARFFVNLYDHCTPTHAIAQTLFSLASISSFSYSATLIASRIVTRRGAVQEFRSYSHLLCTVTFFSWLAALMVFVYAHLKTSSDQIQLGLNAAAFALSVFGLVVMLFAKCWARRKGGPEDKLSEKQSVMVAPSSASVMSGNTVVGDGASLMSKGTRSSRNSVDSRNSRYLRRKPTPQELQPPVAGKPMGPRPLSGGKPVCGDEMKEGGDGGGEKEREKRQVVVKEEKGRWYVMPGGYEC